MNSNYFISVSVFLNFIYQNGNIQKRELEGSFLKRIVDLLLYSRNFMFFEYLLIIKAVLQIIDAIASLEHRVK